MSACIYCQRADVELRPYGPGGTAVCFPCMKDPEHPEREEQAKAAFRVQIEASEVVGGGVSVLGGNGPRPASRRERRLAERALRARPDTTSKEGRDAQGRC